MQQDNRSLGDGNHPPRIYNWAAFGLEENKEIGPWQGFSTWGDIWAIDLEVKRRL
jgi:hypothetical protein